MASHMRRNEWPDGTRPLGELQFEPVSAETPSVSAWSESSTSPASLGSRCNACVMPMGAFTVTDVRGCLGHFKKNGKARLIGRCRS